MSSDPESHDGRVTADRGRAGIRLAGALAELGITALELVEPGRPVRLLAARDTDLPGVVSRASAGCVLRSPDRRVSVHFDRGGFLWRAADGALADELRRRLSQ
jgi:hypothetical protein